MNPTRSGLALIAWRARPSPRKCAARECVEVRLNLNDAKLVFAIVPVQRRELKKEPLPLVVELDDLTRTRRSPMFALSCFTCPRDRFGAIDQTTEIELELRLEKKIVVDIDPRSRALGQLFGPS